MAWRYNGMNYHGFYTAIAFYTDLACYTAIACYAAIAFYTALACYIAVPFYIGIACFSLGGTTISQGETYPRGKTSQG